MDRWKVASYKTRLMLHMVTQHASGKMLFISALETSIYTFNAKEWL